MLDGCPCRPQRTAHSVVPSPLNFHKTASRLPALVSATPLMEDNVPSHIIYFIACPHLAERELGVARLRVGLQPQVTCSVR